jgi:hypothetical protein
MPVDARWRDQPGNAWDGADPRYGGYPAPGAGQPGRTWPDDGRFGYQPDGPPQVHGYAGRDAYAGYQDRQDSYEAARQAPGDQQQVRHPHDVSAGRGQEEQPADGRTAGGQVAGRPAGRARRTGPPAALPPGPSASGAQGSAQDSDAAVPVAGGPAASDGRVAAVSDAGTPGDQTRQATAPANAGLQGTSPGAAGQAGTGRATSDRLSAEPARSAGQADQPADRSQPSAVTATPPSPTGTLPPAVTDVGGSGPPVADSQRGQDGYEVVSPDAETTPMAVILGDRPPTSQQPAEPAASVRERREPRPADPQRKAAPPPAVQRVRGPFEPPAKSDDVENDTPQTPAAEPGPHPAGAAAGTTMSQAARASVWSPTAAKMDQIKDLYLTAEAIGEDALEKHFELVSDRQRQLIREYFDGPVSSGAESSDAAS